MKVKDKLIHLIQASDDTRAIVLLYEIAIRIIKREG